MRDPAATPRPAPARSRAGLLAGGLLLLVAGVALLAWALASAAGLVGRGDATTAEVPPTTALGGGATPTTAGSERRTAVYRLEPVDGPAVTVRLEVAADPATRARGLMGRRQVPQGTGMVFLYPKDVTQSYWMKNTLVPLSIAFVAGDGRVVSVAEMTPCVADPCPSYAPTGPYRYAVELAAGAFSAAGVGKGARVVPADPAGLPEPV